VGERDREIRNRTYALFVELGRAPTADEVGPETKNAWRGLHDDHAVVLDAQGELLMANPFSAVPTPHRVHAAGRDWYGNCAWDAIGICAALHADGRIETSCPDCDEPIELAIRNERPDDESLLFHCLVPAAQWWDDIVFA
jgi:hypothetical protein